MKEWFLGLEQRERRVLVAGAIIAVLSILYGGIIAPLYGSVAQRRENVRDHRELLDWMERTAARVPASGARAAGNANTGNPVTDFTRQTRAAGLQPYLRQTRPNGGDGLRAEFREVPFDDLVRLLATLESTTGMRVVDASVSPGELPGTGNVRLTLARVGA